MQEDSGDLTIHEKNNLKKRYLFWLYKTTKEPLDRIDRKFTQLEIDREILKKLENIKTVEDKNNWDRLLNKFKDYINNKEKDAENIVYSNSQKVIKADYLFLKSKFRIVEQLILDEFGSKQLKFIRSSYEDEMTKRIIQEKEEHR